MTRDDVVIGRGFLQVSIRVDACRLVFALRPVGPSGLFTAVAALTVGRANDDGNLSCRYEATAAPGGRTAGRLSLMWVGYTIRGGSVGGPDANSANAVVARTKDEDVVGRPQTPTCTNDQGFGIDDL